MLLLVHSGSAILSDSIKVVNYREVVMEKCFLSEGGYKVLLLIPQQGRINTAVDVLNVCGILNLVYGSKGNENIAVSIGDVEMAQAELTREKLGVFKGANIDLVSFKVKPICGMDNTTKWVAHHLTCYGIPCWITNSLSISVKREDKEKVLECLTNFRLTFEFFGGRGEEAKVCPM